ncbi:unnamed protein product [Oikopleura dioica]|uniref:histone acetyltransferase n=1 Tax=Oikopleura dioica TaxID=34765 RepID=E4Y2J5_OIKDI|nr:unnamed protein product [Oikopleura dioica]
MPPKKTAKWLTDPDSKKFQKRVQDLLLVSKQVDIEIMQMRRERYNELSKLVPEKVKILRPSGMGKTPSDPEKALEFLEHASECDDADCQSEGCTKMKIIISHAEAHWNYDEKSESSCLLCKNFSTVCRKHANMCITTNCRVFNCTRIKSRLYEIEAKIEAAQKLLRNTA